MNQMNPSIRADEAEVSYDYLGLLARAKQALDSGVEIAVSCSEIRPYPNQPRHYFNEDRIRSLSASIDGSGQTTPGIIRENPGATRYELIDGERRWRAVSLIPAERQPLYKAKVIVADDDVVQYLISGIANFNREGHTPLEIMETVDRLLSFGIPMEEIASLLGITTGWAYQVHGLNKLEPSVSALLDPTLPKQEQLPVSAAIQISKIEGRLQMGLAQRVLKKDITLGRLRSEVIKVAKKEGVTVRVREVSPLKQWESIGNKIDVVARSLADVDAMFDSGQIIPRFPRAHADTSRKMIRRLQEAQEALTHCKQLLEAHTPKKT